MTPSRCLALSLAVLAACAETTEDPVADAGTAGDASTTGDPEILVGSFQVRLVPEAGATPGYTAVFGKIYDGPTPSQVIFEEAMSSGECALFVPRVPFCDPACSGGAICVEDGECRAYPSAHSAGVVTVEGLHTIAGATSFEMTLIANNYQTPASVDLPFDSFAENDTIRIEAAGDYFSAFSAEAKGIAPLQVSSTDLALSRGAPLALAWNAANSSSLIHIKLDISHHGGTKGMIECEAADDGMLELPAAMIDALLDLGVAGFPTIIITRRSSGHGVVDQGRVDLNISQDSELSVAVPGVISCLDDSQCANGSTCQADLTCR